FNENVMKKELINYILDKHPTDDSYEEIYIIERCNDYLPYELFGEAPTIRNECQLCPCWFEKDIDIDLVIQHICQNHDDNNVCIELKDILLIDFLSTFKREYPKFEIDDDEYLGFFNSLIMPNDYREIQSDDIIDDYYLVDVNEFDNEYRYISDIEDDFDYIRIDLLNK
ncbi:2496_t:CDS:2, partial [Scutellospora calospora]